MKFKKIAGIILAVILSFSVLVGCGGDDGEFVYEEIIADFESYNEMTTIYTYYDIGIFKMSDEADYVTSGSHCAMLEIHGSYPEYSLPHIFKPDYLVPNQHIIFDNLDNSFFTRSDFSDAAYLALDMFNASDRDVSVEILLYAYEGTDLHYINLGKKIALKDEQNTLVFDIDADSLIYRGIENVRSIYLVFDNKEEGQTPAKVYMDNLRVGNKKNKSVKQTRQFNNTLLSGFENEIDKDMIKLEVLECAYDFMLIPEISTEKKTQGETSLKFTRPAGRNFVITEWEGYLRLRFNNNYFEGIDLSQHLGKGAEIAIDIYNDHTEEDTCLIGYVGSLGSGGVKHDGNPANAPKLAPKEWTTVRFPLDSLSNGQPIEWNTLQVQITFYEFGDAFDRVVYLDNLRIEMGE